MNRDAVGRTHPRQECATTNSSVRKSLHRTPTTFSTRDDSVKIRTAQMNTAPALQHKLTANS